MLEREPGEDDWWDQQQPLIAKPVEQGAFDFVARAKAVIERKRGQAASQNRHDAMLHEKMLGDEND